MRRGAFENLRMNRNSTMAPIRERAEDGAEEEDRRGGREDASDQGVEDDADGDDVLPAAREGARNETLRD
jgi:hypothetical protein